MPTSEKDVRALLSTDEILEWTGRPNEEAFLKGISLFGLTSAGASPATGILWNAIKVIAIAAVVWWAIDSKVLAGIQTPVPDGEFWLPILGGLIAGFLLYRRASIQAPLELTYARSLDYAITDKRLLELRDGSVERAYTAREVQKPELVPTKNAEGFSDIIWAKKIRRSHSDRTQRRSALSLEQDRIGFKALPDGEAVLQRILAWRERQLARSTEEATTARPAAMAPASPAPSESTKPEDTSRSTLTCSLHDYRLTFPKSWLAKVRQRKLAFGKWGIESEAVWKKPIETEKWNVLRVDSAIGSHVEVQAHKTKPINTFESVLNPKGAILGTPPLVDQNPDYRTGDLTGFQVTRRMAGEQPHLPGEEVDNSRWLTRHHIFHDGARQYYVKSMWPEDAPSEGELCEEIVQSLKTDVADG